MGVVTYPRRDDVWLVSLDPSKGSEIQKTRPCLIVSPDEMNEALQTVLVAPMTSRLREYPMRITLTFRNKTGQVALDQMRTVDRSRLVRRLGTVSVDTAENVSTVLVEMFAR